MHLWVCKWISPIVCMHCVHIPDWILSPANEMSTLQHLQYMYMYINRNHDNYTCSLARTYMYMYHKDYYVCEIFLWIHTQWPSRYIYAILIYVFMYCNVHVHVHVWRNKNIYVVQIYIICDQSLTRINFINRAHA